MISGQIGSYNFFVKIQDWAVEQGRGNQRRLGTDLAVHADEQTSETATTYYTQSSFFNYVDQILPIIDHLPTTVYIG